MGNRHGGIAASYRLTGRVLLLQWPIDRDDKGHMESGSGEQIEPGWQEAAPSTRCRVITAKLFEVHGCHPKPKSATDSFQRPVPGSRSKLP